MIRLGIKIAVMFGLAAGLIWLLSRNDNSRPLAQESVQRLSVAPEFTELDYLFVGPSFMYAGLDPKQFDAVGQSAFNLGTMDAGPYYSDLIVDDAVILEDGCSMVSIPVVTVCTVAAAFEWCHSGILVWDDTDVVDLEQRFWSHVLVAFAKGAIAAMLRDLHRRLVSQQ